MHIESALITAPIALAAWVHRSGGIRKALLEPRRSALRPLAYGLGALAAAEVGHHGGTMLDVLAHLVGGFMLCLAFLEASAWLPRPARERA